MPEIDLTRRRAAYVQDLEASLNGILQQLAALPEVEKVILFGAICSPTRICCW